MSVYNDVLDAVRELAQETNPYADISVGALPPDNGIAMTWKSSNVTPFLNKRAVVEMVAVLNGKHSDSSTVANALCQIHTSLSMRKQYPEEENFQILDISTINAPTILCQDQNSQWLCGSSLRVKFYLRGD